MSDDSDGVPSTGGRRERIRANVAGVPQRERFDSMDQAEQVRFYARIWVVGLVVLGVFVAVRQKDDNPVLWVLGSAVTVTAFVAAAAPLAIKASAKRKARSSDRGNRTGVRGHLRSSGLVADGTVWHTARPGSRSSWSAGPRSTCRCTPGYRECCSATNEASPTPSTSS